ncbi:MAG: YhdH/YhfP family quinone oxidoreductase [Deltaproteobacteria bacterium]|jgi:acrylyl-CoA reductase (NADPH)|nr:YhdH/YhfP family quinone oxidoreductase [Deltaproteobacteria bacterium]
MKQKKFRAMVVDAPDSRSCSRSIQEKTVDELPEGDVLIRVHYSSLNYKDALSATCNRGVTRKYPHTPGIDAAGVVVESAGGTFAAGERVIVTSYDLGMNTPGGFGQYVRVPAEWVVPLPEGLSLRKSMAYGTAGFTAGMSVYEVTGRVGRTAGNILVTGASGGVGSLAVAILAKLGYPVVAASGKPGSAAFLTALGAREIVGRDAVLDAGGKPLLKSRWAGAVDTVGGDILSTVVKSMDVGGTVACCGNVAGANLDLTVFPFILRGVRLIGIDSQSCPMAHRLKIWEKLAGEWGVDMEDDLCREISLDQLDENIERILAGEQTGRVLVNLDR